MKDNNYGVVANWNYVTVSIIVITILTVLVLYMPGIREIDSEMLKVVRRFLGQFPSYIPILITDFGRANNMLWPQIAVCSTLLSHQKYLKTFLFVFFVQASYLLKDLFKNFICRERPCVASDFSFPSGHATTTMCLYGIVIYLILKYTRSQFWRYFLAIFFSLFIFLVALSRLWLGVHFVTDVVAGLFLGFLLVNLYIILDKFFARG